MSPGVKEATEGLDLASSRDTWKELFDCMLRALIDYDQDEAENLKKVHQAARLADTALEAFEERWPCQ